MASTYDSALPADKDWVRFLVGDRGTIVSGTTVSGVVLQDEEIAGLLREEKNKYLAAARAGEVILAQWKNLSSKTVRSLSITLANGRYSTYAELIASLREKGARLLLEASGAHSLRTW